MELNQIADIATHLGFEASELGSLLLRLAPEVLIQRKGQLYANTEMVVAALDHHRVPIPSDPRAPAVFTRRGLPAPSRGGGDPKKAGALGQEGVDDEVVDALDAEILDDEEDDEEEEVQPRSRRSRRGR